MRPGGALCSLRRYAAEASAEAGNSILRPLYAAPRRYAAKVWAGAMRRSCYTQLSAAMWRRYAADTSPVANIRGTAICGCHMVLCTRTGPKQKVVKLKRGG